MSVLITRRPDQMTLEGHSQPNIHTVNGPDHDTPPDTIPGMLSDDSDTTFVSAYPIETITTYPVAWRIGLHDFNGPYDPPFLPNQDAAEIAGFTDLFRIEYVQVRARISLDDVTAGSQWEVWLGRYISGGVYAESLVKILAHVPRDLGWQDWSGPTWTKDLATGKDWSAKPKKYGSLPLSTLYSDVNTLVVGLQATDPTGKGAFTNMSELYVDLSYFRRGSVTITSPAPNTVQGSVFTLQWSSSAPDNPSFPQKSYVIRVYEQSVYSAPGFDPWNPTGAVYGAGVNSSLARSAQIGPLQGGTNYRAYIWIDQPWRGEASNWWSLPDYVEFTVPDSLPSPVVEATAEDALGRVRLLVKGANNMVTEADHSFEVGVGTWTAVSNCSIAQATSGSAPQGDNVLRLTATAAGDAKAGPQAYRIDPAQTYAIQFKVDTTNKAMHLEADILNAANAVLDTRVGASVGPVAGFHDLSLVLGLPLPAGAYRVKVRWVVVAADAAGTYDADMLYIGPHNTATNGPGAETYSDVVYLIERSADAGVTWEKVIAPKKQWPNGFKPTSSVWIQEDTFYDYGAEQIVDIIYRVSASATTNVVYISAPSSSGPAIQQALSEWWWVDPYDSDHNFIVDVLPPFNQKIDEQQAVYHPLKRKFPVVVSDSVSGEDASIKLQTIGTDDWNKLETVLKSQNTMLLRSPFSFQQWYFRIVGPRTPILMGYSFDEPIREVSFSYIEVDVPS